MRCMIVHEWNVRAFFEFFFFLFPFFFHLMNAKCKCRTQIPRLVLPMRYATIVPYYAIDRLLTTDLDVNFLMNADKMWSKSRFFLFRCKCFLSRCRCKISIWCTCSPFRDAIHDANVLCRDEDMKFIYDGASARIYPWCKCLLTEMEMQNVLWCNAF